MQTLYQLPRLVDNHFGDPDDSGYGTDISSEVKIECVRTILLSHQGKSLSQWAKDGVMVFPSHTQMLGCNDDHSQREVFITLGSDQADDTIRTWINTHNCMGVVRLRDKLNGATVQIEIGSRFDEGHINQFTAIPQDGIVKRWKWAGVRLKSLPLGRGV